MTTSNIKYAVKIFVIGVSLIVSSCLYAKPLKVGDIAPNFTGKTLNGESVNLNDLKGKKPVYLKFWATWCSYCLAEFPHLQDVYEKYGNDIEIITINVGINDSIANIENLFTGNGYNVPTIFDEQGELTSKYQVVGTPHHILIDHSGKIAYRTFLASDTLDQKLKAWSNYNHVELNNNKGTK